MSTTAVTTSTNPNNASNLSGLVSGLVSGVSTFNWQSFVDQTITYERAPITAIQTEQTTNNNQITALNTIKADLTALQTASKALQDPTVFSARTATSGSTTSGSTATAAKSTALGNYTVSVSQLATTSSLNGAADIGSTLSATSDVSGLTVSTLPIATAITAGTFTVNGQQVSAALSDSLQDVFTKIAAATSGHGNVTASYDPSTDKISLNAASGQVVLGAANDTSNFLAATQLFNNGSGTISSSGTLGSVAHASTLANANLKSAITAVDSSGNGSFTVNSVTISYNVSTDSLDTVIKRINTSAAGVTATYDSGRDRMVITNNSTGNTGIAVNEASGGLLDALGLTGGASLSLGKDALYTINGSTTLSSKSNTLASNSHGIAGLAITATALGTDTIAVGTDTSSMAAAINTFISAFNTVQADIDSDTNITSANGQVVTSILSGNHDVSDWATSLRNNAFNSVPGLTGTITRLESLGIDFTSGSSLLTIKDQTKLNNALANTPSDVAAFFTQSATGFSARLNTFLTNLVGIDGQTGFISQQTSNLNTSNSQLDDKIAAIQRQLDQQRAQLTASFTAMQTAQQLYSTMQTQLTNAFSSSNSKN